MSQVFSRELVDAVASDVERLADGTSDPKDKETIRMVARQIRGWAGGPIGLSDEECAPRPRSDDDGEMPF